MITNHVEWCIGLCKKKRTWFCDWFLWWMLLAGIPVILSFCLAAAVGSMKSGPHCLAFCCNLNFGDVWVITNALGWMYSLFYSFAVLHWLQVLFLHLVVMFFLQISVILNKQCVIEWVSSLDNLFGLDRYDMKWLILSV